MAIPYFIALTKSVLLFWHNAHSMKKLLLVTDAWSPQKNGVVVALQELKHGLEQRGYKVVVVHPGLFKSVPLLLYPEIHIALLPGGKLRKILETEKPDYIHIATEGPLGLAARSWCLKNKHSFTTAYHTHFPFYIGMYASKILLPKAAESYLRWFHNASTTTMVHTGTLLTELSKKGFTHMVYSPLGVDLKLFRRNPAPDLPSLKKPVFVYFGRLAKEKNVEEFLEAKLPGTKLVIGDGPHRKNLEALNTPHVIFTGYKKDQQLVDWLSLCDVLVFPSRSETFGLVVLEALAVGIPVAAHDVLGPRDIITSGVDGFLSEDLREAAQKCLKLSKERCVEKARLFSWDAAVETFIKNLAP